MTNPIPVQGLSGERLADIAKGCEGVTPGPWEARSNPYGKTCQWWVGQQKQGAGHTLFNSRAINGRVGENEHNAAHLANCDPQTVLALVTELQHSRSEGAGAWPEHASALPWTYHPATPSAGSFDWIEDAYGSIVVEHVGHIDGPAIVAAVNRRSTSPASPSATGVRVSEWGDPNDTEGVLYALDIAAIGAPYSDLQGNLYCHRPYSPDGYRDAEFRDYGLARAVRILCNNAKRIRSALSALVEQP